MISAIVLTKNEEKNISQCLKTLAWCDEIIVIDDYSTDKTRQIAKKHGARVFKRHLKNNYSRQRNFGLKKAQGDWLIFVDADERVPKSLQKEIKQVLKKPTKSGFYIRRQDFFWGKPLHYGETSQLKLVRLAEKSAGRWQGRVHETWQINEPAGLLNNRLIHQRQIDIDDFLTRINRYSSIRAQELYDQTAKSNWFLILAYPLGKFLYNYILKLGFLDCGPGFVIALMMSLHSFLVRVKLFMFYHENQAEKYA